VGGHVAKEVEGLSVSLHDYHHTHQREGDLRVEGTDAVVFLPMKYERRLVVVVKMKQSPIHLAVLTLLVELVFIYRM
jgi:hypothetical protein